MSLYEIPTAVCAQPVWGAEPHSQCCTHRPRLCFATCRSALVLAAGPRLFQNQFLPRKSQLQILITITGTAEVWFPKLLGTGLYLFQWGQSQLVCTGVQSSTCWCLLRSWSCSPGNHLCLMQCLVMLCTSTWEHFHTMMSNSSIRHAGEQKVEWKTLLNSCKHGTGWKVKIPENWSHI